MSFINICTKAMKNERIHIIRGIWRCRILLLSLITGALFLFPEAAMAQDAGDSSSKLSFTMNLSSVVTDGKRTVKVQLSRKANKKTVVVRDLKSPLNLYLNEVKEQDPSDGTGWISKLHTGYEGEGLFEFPASFYKLTSGLHTFNFIVKMEADPVYEDAEEQITVSDAKISIVYSGEDSIKTATATLTAWNDSSSSYVPVPDAELKLCLKRTFNCLPFGETGIMTSETGEISGELPLDLPGNADGTITIAARLEEDEKFGNIEATTSVPWAVLPRVNPVRGRTLWSSGDNAPLVLVISSVAIIGIIWGTIIYLVYLLFKIKRLGKTP